MRTKKIKIPSSIAHMHEEMQTYSQDSKINLKKFKIIKMLIETWKLQMKLKWFEIRKKIIR